MSDFSTFLHQIPSSYIKLQHDFDHEREKSQTEEKLGKKQSFLAKNDNFPSCALRHYPCA